MYILFKNILNFYCSCLRYFCILAIRYENIFQKDSCLLNHEIRLTFDVYYLLQTLKTFQSFISRFSIKIKTGYIQSQGIYIKKLLPPCIGWVLIKPKLQSVNYKFMNSVKFEILIYLYDAIKIF
jgi:hypothetical protein